MENNANDISLMFKQYTPAIMLGSGIALGIAALITSNVVTFKNKEEIVRYKKKIQNANRKIRDIKKNGPKDANGNIPALKDAKKERRIYRKDFSKFLVKKYGIPVGLEVISAGLEIGSDKILSDRLASTASLLTLTTTEFGKYRQNVANRYGKDIERKIYNGVEEERIEKEVTTKNGKTKKVTETKEKEPEVVDNKVKDHAYTFVYCKGCTGWSPNPRESMNYLELIEKYLTDRLHDRGHVFLNEALDALGINRVLPYGNTAGWYIKDKKHSDAKISLGYMDKNNPDKNDFINGRTTNVVLDLNCQGDIMSLLTKGK